MIISFLKLVPELVRYGFIWRQYCSLVMLVIYFLLAFSEYVLISHYKNMYPRNIRCNGTQTWQLRKSNEFINLGDAANISCHWVNIAKQKHNELSQCWPS